MINKFHTRYCILFSLLEEIQNTKNQKKGNLKKSKRNRVSCFNICIVVFPFLFSTVEERTTRNFLILPAIQSVSDRCSLLSPEKFFFAPLFHAFLFLPFE